MTWEEAIKFGEMYLEMNEDSKDSDTHQFIKVAIEALKSQNSCNQLETDCIDRQDAQIEQQHGRVFKGIIAKPYFLIEYIENGQEFTGYGTYKPEVLSEYLKKYFIPPSQSEPLTDMEQRIFLAAMRREEKVCEQVDYEFGKPYDDSLVRICHKITRKVKGALWD